MEGAKARLSRVGLELRSRLGAISPWFIAVSPGLHPLPSHQPTHIRLSPVCYFDQAIDIDFAIKTTRDNMLPNGRGAVAHIEYTGEEAAPEIRKLLGAVVG